MHTKSYLKCMEGSLIWSGRNKCHPLGIHPSAITISPHTSPFQDVPVFCSCEMELCSNGRTRPDAQRSQHKPEGSVWSRALGLWEEWCCGPTESDFYTVVYFPMHLCSILSCQRLRADKLRAETRARLSTPIPCRDNVLAFKEFHLIPGRSWIPGKAGQQLCSLYCSSFPWFYLCCRAALPAQGDIGSLLCVCWLLSLCIPRTSLPWALGSVSFSIFQVSAHTPCTETEHWSAPQVFVAFLELLSCPWHWGVWRKWGLTADGRQV